MNSFICLPSRRDWSSRCSCWVRLETVSFWVGDGFLALESSLQGFSLGLEGTRLLFIVVC